MMNAMDGRWCILRTAGPSTLLLARTLNAAGIAAWTPTITTKRKRPKSNETIEVSAALVPTFVFAPWQDVPALLAVRRAEVSPHPTFAVLRLGDGLASVRERSLSNLRAEEAAAAARMAADKDRAARAALLRTEAARRKALRAEVRDYPTGTNVTTTAAAFAGLTGVVEEGDGRSFVVAFGGSLRIEIEAWQLEHVAVYSGLPEPA